MDNLTVERALELRAIIKSMTHAERTVLGNILNGEYDRYKDSALTIANEDLDFLSKD
ncbi:hypothetical protein N9878_00810 [bacterium]|nr:hypothetical protein [bacterium]